MKNNKIKLFELSIFIILLLLGGLCLASWDNDLPGDNSIWNDAAGMIRDNWDALEVIFGIDLVGEGSAYPWYQSAVPTTKADGSTALAAAQNGLLWIDSDTGFLYCYQNGSADADDFIPFAEWVKPEFFGATADGSTDDSTAFTSAVAAGRAIVLDGSKTYKAEFIATVGTTIYGNGAVLDGEIRVQGNNIKIYDVNFVNSEWTTEHAGERYEIYCSSSSVDSKNVLVSGCRFKFVDSGSNNHGGLYASSYTNGVVEDWIVENCVFDTIDYFACTFQSQTASIKNIRIENCRFNSVGDTSVSLVGAPTNGLYDALVKNCHFNNSDDKGIELGNSYGAKILNNYFVSFDSPGFWISFITTATERNRYYEIAENTFVGNTNYSSACLLQNSNYGNIHNNVIYNEGYIRITGEYNHFHHNRIYTDSNWALSLGDGGDGDTENSIIENNYLDNSAASGSSTVVRMGTGTHVGNVFRENIFVPESGSTTWIDSATGIAFLKNYTWNSGTTGLTAIYSRTDDQTALDLSVRLLSSTSSVDMKTAQKNTLYTVPTGLVAYVTHVVVRDPSASMSGGTDYDFGTGASADTWKQSVDLSSLTTLATDYIVLDNNNTKYTENAADAVFGVKVITGTTAACTATIDVFGYTI